MDALDGHVDPVLMVQRQIEAIFVALLGTYRHAQHANFRFTLRHFGGWSFKNWKDKRERRLSRLD